MRFEWCPETTPCESDSNFLRSPTNPLRQKKNEKRREWEVGDEFVGLKDGRSEIVE